MFLVNSKFKGITKTQLADFLVFNSYLERHSVDRNYLEVATSVNESFRLHNDYDMAVAIVLDGIVTEVLATPEQLELIESNTVTVRKL